MPGGERNRGPPNLDFAEIAQMRMSSKRSAVQFCGTWKCLRTKKYSFVVMKLFSAVNGSSDSPVPRRE